MLKDISSQHSLQARAWLLLVTCSKVYNEDSEKKKKVEQKDTKSAQLSKERNRRVLKGRYKVDTDEVIAVV